MKPSETSQVRWNRLQGELQAYRASEAAIWGGIDDLLLGRYLSGECSAEEVTRVDEAAKKFPAVQQAIDLITNVLNTEAEAKKQTGDESVSDEFVALSGGIVAPTNWKLPAANIGAHVSRKGIGGVHVDRMISAEQPTPKYDTDPNSERHQTESFSFFAAHPMPQRLLVALTAASVLIAFGAGIKAWHSSSEILRITAERDKVREELAQNQKSKNPFILQPTGDQQTGSVDWETLLKEHYDPDHPAEITLALLETGGKKVREKILQLRQRKPVLTSDEILRELFREFGGPKEPKRSEK